MLRNNLLSHLNRFATWQCLIMFRLTVISLAYESYYYLCLCLRAPHYSLYITTQYLDFSIHGLIYGINGNFKILSVFFRPPLFAPRINRDFSLFSLSLAHFSILSICTLSECTGREWHTGITKRKL